ncbi:MAG: multidrug effflux MFS transporter [Crocinitomicaceae bacterium]|nr:multidrug effflux MFS transporter [Crocinitomicaceae bacterium]
MNSTKKQSQFYLILILGLLSAIGPLSIDMYLPAFPSIAKGLNTTVASVMLSLSSFFIGISLGQLLYGPLLERYGRKKPLYFGLALYAISSLACATALSVETLIVFRFFQALGGCVGMVASRAMVRDLFDVKDNAKVFSTLMLVIAVSPIIAPSLGGLITTYIGWRYIFVMLIIVIAAIIAGIYFLLPDSKGPDPSYSLKPTAILSSFSSIIKHPQFALYTFSGSVASAGLYAFISGSPYVFLEIFKVTEQHYGWVFAFVASGLIGSSQLNSIFLKKYKSEQIIKVALYFQSFVAIVLASTALFGFSELYSTILLIFLYLCCQGFIFPNASALSMAPFGHNAGNASALMGFIQMSLGALMSAMVSVLHNESTIPMTGVMAFCSVLASLIFAISKIQTVRAASVELVEEEEVEMINTL